MDIFEITQNLSFKSHFRTIFYVDYMSFQKPKNAITNFFCSPQGQINVNKYKFVKAKYILWISDKK